jgi:hypothetical protein
MHWVFETREDWVKEQDFGRSIITRGTDAIPGLSMPSNHQLFFFSGFNFHETRELISESK